MRPHAILFLHRRDEHMWTMVKSRSIAIHATLPYKPGHRLPYKHISLYHMSASHAYAVITARGNMLLRYAMRVAAALPTSADALIEAAQEVQENCSLKYDLSSMEHGASFVAQCGPSNVRLARLVQIRTRLAVIARSFWKMFRRENLGYRHGSHNSRMRSVSRAHA